jgi:predicted nuclease with TOPRIM domain
MMTEERTRFEVLLESIETKVKVIAEGHGVLVERSDALAEGQRMLVERLDRIETKVDVIESRFTRLETKVDGLETKVDGLETKVDGLEVFASDAQGRLKRIETHLQLKRASRSAPRYIATSAAPSKRRRRAVTAEPIRSPPCSAGGRPVRNWS